MANEAVMVYRLDPALPFTVANGTGIEKGALLKMSDPMTAAAATAATDKLAGIASTEKIASDGKTKLGIYRRGVFKMYVSGAANIGDPVTAVASYTNYVAKAAVTASGACVLGHMLETAASGETALVYVDVGAGSPSIS